MIDKLISFSIHNKLIIILFVLALIGWGFYSAKQIPIDAVPDITTNQVQVMTHAPTLAAQEVEQFITFPIEISMANLPNVDEIRSISRFGISVVTIVFDDNVDIYLARQLINEQLKIAETKIPEGFGSPELGPITTGLGEVYQYILHTEPGYDTVYSDMDLRMFNDWIVKRQLAGTPGVIEVSGWGGHLKQYEVAVNPERLNSMKISIAEVFKALESNNENTGGSYIENRFNTYFIRGEGLVKSLDDLNQIVVKKINNTPILIRDIATVGFGTAPRFGAITWNGQGEAVGGQALMLKGENSYEVVQAVKERIAIIQKSLPEGVVLVPFIDRSKLISRAIKTVATNLIEGGLIVILILVLLLGNYRGGLIVASVIPLAMLFAIGMMHLFGVSANLMSLGAIDFGLVVDGSVIIVESILHRLTTKFNGQQLTPDQMNREVNKASSRIRSSAAFGEIIILIVYLPILALVGIEGKMFTPMAQTVSFAIGGALILSMTYVPMMSALFLKKRISTKITFSDRLIGKLQKWYEPVLHMVLRRKKIVILSSIILFAMSMFTFNRLGGEFIPTLEEGDFALHQILPPGSSLQQSIEVSEKIQNVLLENFPEVEMVVSKIGTSDIATDPMPIEVGDIMVRMKPKSEWVSASSKEEMFEKMEAALSIIPGVQYEFTQPIQMRFNELIAGVREDVAIKIYGENLEVLFEKGKEAEQIIKNIDGIGDIRVEQTQGLPQMIVSYERQKIAQYGLNIKDLNTTLRTAFAGEVAGVVFEEERRFDLVIRLDKKYRQDIDDIRNLYIPLPDGHQIPLKEVATIELKSGPMQISRENARRRIVVGVNARNRDIESLVEEIDQKLSANLILPAGYYIDYGGQFENLVEAKQRLMIAVPIALLLIFSLLFFTFRSIKQALLIFTAIPLSAIGGVYALWLRDMPFSISAGIGFIALFGVAVLNGIVLIAYFNQLKQEGVSDMYERIFTGTRVRMRPVIMTAAVAAFGFLPMALSGSAGAEVQRPLATVVIGGLITATLLTLLVLPVLYSIFDKISIRAKLSNLLPILFLGLFFLTANSTSAQDHDTLTMNRAINMAVDNHPLLQVAKLGVEQQQKLKKTAIDLDKTRIQYAQGEINAPIVDYQWYVTQEIKFPTTYIAQSKLQKENVLLSEQRLALTLVELTHHVKKAWWQLAYAHDRLKLINTIANIDRNFSEVANKRFDIGEINVLEKLVAENEYQEIILQQQQAEADVLIYKQQLLQWLGTDSTFILPTNAMQKVPPYIGDTSQTSNNPMLSYYRQNAEVAKQFERVKKSDFLPDLNLGYFNQQVVELEGLQGFQVGVAIPLFFWTQQGHVQSAKISSAIAQVEYQNQQRKIYTLIHTKMQEMNKYLLRLNWYEDKGLKTADELLRYASKSYQIGDIDYVEYLNTSNKAVEIKSDYLSVLNDYNQAVTDLQLLNGDQ